MISNVLFEKFYYDTKYDGTERFYRLVRGLCRPDHRVLNLGAGPATRNSVRCLKGEVAELVGADPDPIVLQNNEIDRAVLIVNGKIDVQDAYFDIIWSDFVLEHVENPASFLLEVSRILKPNGHFLFRTPNLHHYVSVIARMTTHAFHVRFANVVRGMSVDAHEPWPTYHRMNTRHRLKRCASEAGLLVMRLEMVECEPSYLLFHPLPFICGVAYERLVNSSEIFAEFRANIFGDFVKCAPTKTPTIGTLDLCDTSK